MPSANDIAMKVDGKLIELYAENAALTARVQEQKARIDFLERTVTQMIHTAYNAPTKQIVPCGTGAPTLWPEQTICQTENPQSAINA